MTKVVYNGCYGGFSLSREAVLKGREISGNPLWGGACLKGDQSPHGYVVPNDYGHIEDVERHDPVLVKVVEMLGEKANGSCARLRIHDLGDQKAYRITEYDGMEDVETQENIGWTYI